MLHVVAKNDYPLVGMEVPVDLRDLWKARVADAQKKLDLFLAEEFHGLPVKRLLLEGDPAIHIVETAHANGTTLKEEALRLGFVSANEFDRLVQPEKMTRPG